MRENDVKKTAEGFKKKTAEEFNKEFFNNEINLGNIRFRVSNKMSQTRGSYNPRKNEITLSGILMCSEEDWHLTLLHEMIHAWEYTVLHARPGHGYNFKRKAQDIRIASNGKYDISRTTAAKSTVVAEATEQRKVSRIKNQFIVEKPYNKGKYNFLKNLTPGEVEYLVGKNYKVYRVENPVANVRHCKNLQAFMRANYYYSERVVNRLGVQATKL